MKNNKALSVVCSELSGPGSLKLQEIDIQALGNDDVCIAVVAASLNFPDLLMTYGKYQFKPELPFVLGMEGAGIVIETGPNVSKFRLGDRVMFKGKTGACSSHITVHASNVETLPASLSFEEGAAFAVTFFTAYIALQYSAGMKKGDILLVHGAGGGVGQATVSVGKALGAIVIAAASTDEKLDIARKSGADHCVNYTKAAFSEAVLAATNGHGADVIVDPVGGDVLDESVYCLAWQGKLLSVGFASGEFGNVSLSELQRRGGRLVGVRAGEYSRRNPEIGKAAYRELSSLVSKHTLKPWIGKRWPLEKVSDALAAMEAREVLGKQVIVTKCGQ